MQAIIHKPRNVDFSIKLFMIKINDTPTVTRIMIMVIRIK